MPHRPVRTPPPAAVTDTITQVGHQIAAARRRRRWTQADLARKAGIARLTLHKLEAGAPGTSLAVLGAVLWAMRLDQPLTTIAALESDPEGLALEEARLGQRVRPAATIDDNF